MADILKPEFGKPETIAFKFESGKEVQGRFGAQVAFSAIDQTGRDLILYLDKQPAAEVESTIRQLGIRTREFFQLVKVKDGNTTRVNILRIPPTNGAAGAHSWQGNAPAPVQPAAETTSERAQGTISARVCASMCVLIDAMAEAKAYAHRKQIDLTNEDLRCLANTAFIQESRGGAR